MPTTSSTLSRLGISSKPVTKPPHLVVFPGCYSYFPPGKQFSLNFNRKNITNARLRLHSKLGEDNETPKAILGL